MEWQGERVASSTCLLSLNSHISMQEKYFLYFLKFAGNFFCSFLGWSDASQGEREKLAAPGSASILTFQCKNLPSLPNFLLDRLGWERNLNII